MCTVHRTVQCTVQSVHHRHMCTVWQCVQYSVQCMHVYCVQYMHVYCVQYKHSMCVGVNHPRLYDVRKLCRIVIITLSHINFG